jgi:hypothetical protein
LQADNDTPDLPPLVPAPAPDEPSVNRNAEPVYEPRNVIGDRGAGWIMEAWDLYKQQPKQWLLLCFVGFCLLVLISIVSGVQILNSLFANVWSAGLLVTCVANYRGDAVKATHLFAGFKLHLVKLIQARLIVLALSVVIIGIVMGSMALQIAQAAKPEEVILEIGVQRFAIRVLIAIALVLPIQAAGWFAPALIALGGLSVKAALIFSFQACCKNLWPFLIYSVLWIILGVLNIFTLGIGTLVLFPVLQLSTYLAYRDIFLQSPAQESL